MDLLSPLPSQLASQLRELLLLTEEAHTLASPSLERAIAIMTERPQVTLDTAGRKTKFLQDPEAAYSVPTCPIRPLSNVDYTVMRIDDQPKLDNLLFLVFVRLGLRL